MNKEERKNCKGEQLLDIRLTASGAANLRLPARRTYGFRRGGLMALGLLLCTFSAAVAQDYEKQAAEILKLYESGQKDTAYTLVEPLKQNARFVPAAIYVRAQMTPDDRALNLYREIIALEPSGAWADEATYQLVRRYVDKRDSLAAWTWFGVLQKNYAQSPYVSGAAAILDTVKTWEIEMPETAGQGGNVAAASPSSKSTGTAAGTSGKSGSASSKTPSSSGAKGNTSATSSASTKSSSTSSSDFSGYALQVGLYPTKAAAEKRVKELESGPLRPKIFPKEVDGKTQYALVVGPYADPEEANKAKASVAKACNCDAFRVKVE